MKTWQRNTLLGLAGLLVVIVVLVAAVPGPHHPASKVAAGAAPAGATTTTVDTAPPTTPVSLAPVTEPPTTESPTTAGPPPTTAAPPNTTAPPTTAPPATTSTTAPGPIVDGKNAVLRPPSKPVTKPYGGDCNALADGGWNSRCGSVDTGQATLAWLIETMPSGASQVSVYRVEGAVADQVLQASDDGTGFRDAKAIAADVAGDGHQEIGFGFRDQGSGGILGVDLVGGTGTVLVHRDYGDGSAKVSKGQLEGWGTDSPATGRYTDEVIASRGGAWRIVSSKPVSQGDVPPSQL